MSGFIGDDMKGTHAFVQWKGTDVCLDFYCDCGRHSHFDGYFCYAFKCECGQVWEMPCFIVPRKSTKERNPYFHDNPVMEEKEN